MYCSTIVVNMGRIPERTPLRWSEDLGIIQDLWTTPSGATSTGTSQVIGLYMVSPNNGIDRSKISSHSNCISENRGYECIHQTIDGEWTRVCDSEDILFHWGCWCSKSRYCWHWQQSASCSRLSWSRIWMVPLDGTHPESIDDAVRTGVVLSKAIPSESLTTMSLEPYSITKVQ